MGIRSIYKGGILIEEILHERYSWREHAGNLMADMTSIDYEEAIILYSLVLIRKPKIIFEAGCNKGISTLALGLAAKQINASIYTCDTNDMHKKTIEEINKEFGTKIVFLKGKSTRVVVPQGIDFFFHDSDHTRNYPSREFERVEPLLSDKHLLAYHDTLLQNDGSVQKHIMKLQAEKGYNCILLGGNRGISILEK